MNGTLKPHPIFPTTGGWELSPGAYYRDTVGSHSRGLWKKKKNLREGSVRCFSSHYHAIRETQDASLRF